MNRCIVCGRKIRQQDEGMCKTCTEYEDKLIQKNKVIADCKELLKDISENFDGVNDYLENWGRWWTYKQEFDKPIYVSKEVFEKLKNSGCLYEPKIDIEEENRVLKKVFDQMWTDLMNYILEYQRNSTNEYVIACCKEILSEMWHTRLNRDLYIEQAKGEKDE